MLCPLSGCILLLVCLVGPHEPSSGSSQALLDSKMLDCVSICLSELEHLTFKELWCTEEAAFTRSWGSCFIRESVLTGRGAVSNGPSHLAVGRLLVMTHQQCYFTFASPLATQLPVSQHQAKVELFIQTPPGTDGGQGCPRLKMVFLRTSLSLLMISWFLGICHLSLTVFSTGLNC